MVSETPTTVNTAAGSIYRKSDIAKVKIPVTGLTTSGSNEGQNDKKNSHLEKPKRKHQRQETEPPLERNSEGETLQQPQCMYQGILKGKTK